MAPWLDESTDDIQEDKPAPDGMYDLRITSAEAVESEGGRDGIMVIMAIDGHDDEYSSVIERFWAPMEGDKPRGRKFMLLNLKRFCACFNIPIDFDDPSTEFPGATARCAVKLVRDSYVKDGEKREIEKNELSLPRLA